MSLLVRSFIDQFFGLICTLVLLDVGIGSARGPALAPQYLSRNPFA
jgi:hypothetical protein